VLPELVKLVTAQLEDDKAQDVLVIDVSRRTAMADYMILASGTSQRHVAAMAQHLIEKLKKDGKRALAEGMAQGDWVAIDAGDALIHLFRPEVRDFYRLEEIWQDAPAKPAKPKKAGGAKKPAKAKTTAQRG